LTRLIDEKQELVDRLKQINNLKNLKNMELLVAFLIAFGVVNSGDATKLTSTQASELIKKSDLQKNYIIWEVEGDDF